MKISMNKIAVVCVGIALLVMLSACQREEVTIQESVSTETMQDAMEAQEAQPETNDMGEDMKESESADMGSANADAAAQNEHLAGKVCEVTSEGLEISQTVILEENGNVQMVDEKDARKVRVIFTSETKFEHWTIQGGGADIEKRTVSSSDITEGMMLELSGYYEGEDYIAVLVLIEEYV